MIALLKKIEDLTEAHEKAKGDIDKLWGQFGVTVRETRETARVSLVDLAAQIGMSKSDLSYREKGDRPWDIPTARKVADALK